MRVAHFVPAYRRVVDVDVAMALAREATFCASRRWTHMPFYVDASNIARARNLGVRQAFQHRADLLLMQDADCFAVFPTFSALDRLWRSMEQVEAAVVGAAIVTRHGQGMNCEPARPDELYAGEVGTGLMLIDLRKLTELPTPWFREEHDARGERVVCGEDIAFCRAVRAAGHPVFVDYTFPTGHAFSEIVASTVAAVHSPAAR